MRNPDHYYIDSFAMYDPSERVSEEANQHFHDAHKKKAIHDIAAFNHEHHAKDLLHDKSGLMIDEDGGEDMSEKELLAEIPQEMTEVVNTINRLKL